MLSFKALANQTTTSNTELFAIRLDITKATNIDIEWIIFITNSLSSVRKVVDTSIYFEQAHFLVVFSILRLLFSYSLNYKIKLWC